MMQRVLILAALVGALAACGSDDTFPFFPFADTNTGGDGGTDAGGDAGGDSGGDSGTGCVEASECDDGQECQSSRCVTVYTTDEECSGAEPVCDTASGVCVQCLGDSNCDTDETCRDFVCLAACAEADDCASNEACEDGVCVALPQICVAGDQSCDGADRVLCNEDGTRVEYLACEEGTLCLVEDGEAKCVSGECEAGEFGCFDTVTAFVCAEDGSERIAVACQDGEECVDGACQDAELCFDIEPWQVDFGSILVGDTVSADITITSCDSLAVEIVDLRFDRNNAFYVEDMSTPFWVEDETTFTVIFEPESEGEFLDTLLVYPGIGDPHVVEFEGVGVDETGDCPRAVARCRPAGGSFSTRFSAPVGTLIECDGSTSSGGAGVSEWFWSFTGRPAGSTASVPGSSSSTTRFTLDRVGAYVLSLDVVDADGTHACAPSLVNVTATNETPTTLPPIHAQLTWSNSADLDNHLRRAAADWATSPGDCYYANKTPDWGVPGVRNNPALDLDVTTGFGPENINIGEVEAGVLYTSGVYVSDLNANASTVAMMTLFIDGEPVDEFEMELDADGQFWQVFSIQFDARGDYTVTELGAVTLDYP